MGKNKEIKLTDDDKETVKWWKKLVGVIVKFVLAIKNLFKRKEK